MAASDSDERSLREVRRAVVKVLAVADPPDYEQPWQTLGATEATGSGAIVDMKGGRRVLTNAHVVEHQTFVEVRRYGHARRYEAEVEGVAQECDLALLHVENERFFSGTRPIDLGTLPQLGDRVSALGFPIGGDRLSVTEGVVSRIEMSTYTQSRRRLLSVQIDAAINPGNSGGPVIQDGLMAGIAFEALEEAENIGYVIPAPIVRRFLADLEDGVFDGFPHLGVDTQPLESDAHRMALGLTADGPGVLVTRVHYGGSAWKQLFPGDVLLAVDGVEVASDGTVRFRGGARIEFTHRVAMHHVGETLRVGVWREGQRIECQVPLAPARPLVPQASDLRYARYFLYAGLLFVPLTGGLLRSWGDDWRRSAPAELLALYEGGVRTPSTREIVVLQKVLADPVNRGYDDLEHRRVVKVQGRRVRDLGELARRVDRSREAYVLFEMADGRQVVVDRRLAAERQATILRRYGVARDRAGVRGVSSPRGKAAPRRRQAPGAGGS